MHTKLLVTTPSIVRAKRCFPSLYHKKLAHCARNGSAVGAQVPFYDSILEKFPESLIPLAFPGYYTTFRKNREYGKERE